MPCYLFTFHAYGSWLPDHYRGYVKRGAGYQPANTALAQQYRSRMNEPAAFLLAAEQKIAIDTLVEAVGYIDCQLHYVATDRTHIHVLVSWKDETPWQRRRASLRKAVTINLKRLRGREAWLSEGSSRKSVRSQQHYDYLMTTYLPKHQGLKWSAEKGRHC